MSIHTKPPHPTPATLIQTLTEMAKHPGNYGWAPQEALNYIKQLETQNTINNAIITIQDQLLNKPPQQQSTNPKPEQTVSRVV